MSSEKQQDQGFIEALLRVFGVEDSRAVGTFQEKTRIGNNTKWIDYLWKNKIAIEMKSKGENLDSAFEQLKQYMYSVPEEDIPDLWLVSDFENIRLCRRSTNELWNFKTKDLRKHIKRFADIAGYETERARYSQIEVNVRAAEKMAKLHDQLKDHGYDGHDLRVYLVRLLFCLFADDTGIFPQDNLYRYIEVSKPDGSDLSEFISKLFEVLNMPPEVRAKKTLLSDELKQFRYINGKLFADRLAPADFNVKMRQIILDCLDFDWNKISPAIFGAMFQGVMDKTQRREIGAHYTSEENILKLIKPLFLDELWREFDKVKTDPTALDRFHGKIAQLKFLDPACGCGNFLIITYRELRELELEVLKMKSSSSQLKLDIEPMLKVSVEQFYGIEYEGFPCQIAQVGIWLTDHQMNLKVSEQFGQYFARLPLTQSATIVHGNALRIDWESVVPKSELSYILGNPPFVGYSNQNEEQKADILSVYLDVNGKPFKNAGKIDYVAAWYYKAAKYMAEATNPRPTGTPFQKGAEEPQANILPRDKALKPRSSELRTNATKQENRLWYDFLRHHKPRFTRQRIIGEYIVDFYCHEASLVIELDGSQHYEPAAMEYDEVRTTYLNSLGIHVLRFANNEIDKNFDAVCTAIKETVQTNEALEQAPFGKGVPVGRGFVASGMGSSNGAIRAAFVSTNSITQGEQVAAVWKPLFEMFGIQIDFAYRTFKWGNEAKGKAAVHCVIVGFSVGQTPVGYAAIPFGKGALASDVLQPPLACPRLTGERGCPQGGGLRTIYDNDGTKISANNINPYLVDAPNIFVENRKNPLCDAPEMITGNRPADGGNLIIEAGEYEDFIAKEPLAKKYIKRLIGAVEFINNKDRYCLWLINVSPSDLRKMPFVMERAEKCRQMRLASPDAGTRSLADTPTLFRETHNPGAYIVIPSVSSERRRYIPIGFLNSDTIATNLVLIIPEATLYHFGILTSSVHMAWNRTVCGRLKSDYRYSKDIVYNNFPWPGVTDAQKSEIEKLAQAVLDARGLFPDSSLADLYDPLTMPPGLLKAHQNLDRAVMKLYGFAKDMTEAGIVAELMGLYVGLVNKDNHRR